MKAKVLMTFRDKYTGRLYRKGEEITLARERFEEILSVHPFIEEIKPKAKKKKEA